MINLIKFILFLAIVYLAVMAVSYYDTKIIIDIYSYQIQASLFLSIAAFIICILLVSALLRIIQSLFKIPSLIYKKYTQINIDKEIDFILNSYSSIIISGTQDKQKLESKSKDSKYKNHLTLILSIIEDNFEKKISYLAELSGIKEYSFYSYYKLAEIMVLYKNYNQALINANKALSYNKKHNDLNSLLIDIYVNLDMQKELDELVSFLKKHNIIINHPELVSRSKKNSETSPI
jgi:uncharacterized protein HemY